MTRSFIMFRLFLLLGLFAAIIGNATTVLNPEELPEKGAHWLEIVKWCCIVGVPFIFDCIMRYIPTMKNWSWVSYLLKGLTYVPKIIEVIYQGLTSIYQDWFRQTPPQQRPTLGYIVGE